MGDGARSDRRGFYLNAFYVTVVSSAGAARPIRAVGTGTMGLIGDPLLNEKKRPREWFMPFRLRAALRDAQRTFSNGLSLIPFRRG
jgi:hypothetical protein